MKALFLLLLTIAMACGADEAPAGPRNVTHRITGLFAPDREADLRRALQDLPGIELVSLDFDHALGVFRYDPAVVFKGEKPEKIDESFDQKLANASNRTLGIQPLCATPADRLARVEIPIGVLDCKACALAVYETIFKIDGVAQAGVNRKEGLVTALIDPAKTDRAALEEAFKKRGVPVKKPEDAAAKPAS